MKKRIIIEANQNGEAIRYVVNPEIESATSNILARYIYEFSRDGFMIHDFTIEWEPIRFERRENYIYISEFNFKEKTWNNDITISMTNILGASEIKSRLALPSSRCLYFQNIAVENTALSNKMVIFCRIATQNKYSSGWIVYDAETWRRNDGEIYVPNELLKNISTMELVNELNPLLVQALQLPNDSQFAYIRGESSIIYITDSENLELPLLNFD